MAVKRRAKKRTIKLAVFDDVFGRMSLGKVTREELLSFYPDIWSSMTGRHFATLIDRLALFGGVVLRSGAFDYDEHDLGDAFPIFRDTMARHYRVRTTHGFDDADAWREEFDEPDWIGIKKLMRTIRYNQVYVDIRKEREKAK